MEEDTKYKKYLKALERIEAKTQLDKATKKVKDMERLLQEWQEQVSQLQHT
jgi:hypothetical protein